MCLAENFNSAERPDRRLQKPSSPAPGSPVRCNFVGELASFFLRLRGISQALLNQIPRYATRRPVFGLATLRISATCSGCVCSEIIRATTLFCSTASLGSISNLVYQQINAFGVFNDIFVIDQCRLRERRNGHRIRSCSQRQYPARCAGPRMPSL